MGLESALINFGIRLENTAQRLQIFSGAQALQWPTGDIQSPQQTSLIYRMPRDPRQRGSMFLAAQCIIVNAGETAVALYDGRPQGALTPGVHMLERTRFTSGLDVVWIKTGLRTIRWGVGEITSRDGIQLTANGVVHVRVRAEHALKFVEEVVLGVQTLQDRDLQEKLLLPRIQGVLRSAMASMRARKVQTDREVVVGAVRANLTGPLLELGLELAGIDVAEVGFPDEFKAAVAQKTQNKYMSRGALLQANTDAEIRRIKAVAAADAQRLLGAAHLEVLAGLQAQGINPLAHLAIKTVAELAATGASDQTKIVPIAQAIGVLVNPANSANTYVRPAPELVAITADTTSSVVEQSTLPPSPVPVPVPVIEVSASQDDAQPDWRSTAIAQLERQIDDAYDRVLAGTMTEDFHRDFLVHMQGRLARLRGT